MARVKFRKGFNVNRVVKRLVRTVLALYVGGMVMTTFGTTMSNTTSPFYTGLTLIGWSTEAFPKYNSTTWCAECTTGCGDPAGAGAIASASGNCLTSTSGSGVLAVVGIIAIAQIITEFITW